MPGFDTMTPVNFDVVASSLEGPVFKCRWLILFLNVLLTCIGGILAVAGYSGSLEEAWGHLGLVLLIIGSVIGTTAYAYSICKRDTGTLPAYQSLPHIDDPSTFSESENPNAGGAQPQPTQESQFQDSDESVALVDPASRQAEGENMATKELLNEVANILTAHPSESSKFPSSESIQSKGSLYISAEMPGMTSDESAKTEKEPLLPKQDTELES